jgi:flagellar capping protein FliD
VRDSNSIDDLIPGVTLSLQEASEKKIRLKVEPDRDAAKEARYLPFEADGFSFNR